MTLILGIESSCDETAVAIISDDKHIHAHLIQSQIQEHLPFGGVVPEIASRAHMEILDTLISQALTAAKLNHLNQLDGIAVTSGPGLIGGLMVGVMTAKAISSVCRLPLIGINHLEAHALTVRLTDEVTFPYLLLLVSGGHCQLLIVKNIGEYQKLGGTLDDALGEAFDKVAKILGLSYPGGPIVEQYALRGNPQAFDFPRPLKGKAGCNFSFSGLKTAVKRQVDALGILTEQHRADICASFQAAIGDIILDRLEHAFEIYTQTYPHNYTDSYQQNSSHIPTLVLAGGVAANRYIRDLLSHHCQQFNICLKTPPIHLCTDNGAMIAWAGIERFQLGIFDDLTLTPRARWPLEELTGRVEKEGSYT